MKEKEIPFSWYLQKYSKDLTETFLLIDLVIAFSAVSSFLYFYSKGD